MLTHNQDRISSFVTIRQGRAEAKPGKSEAWSKQDNFAIRSSDGSDSGPETYLSTDSDIADPARGLDVFLSSTIRVRDTDSEPNLQLSVQDEKGTAKLLVQNPGMGEDAVCLELAIGNTEELKPEVFEPDYFVEQVGTTITSLIFRPAVSSESGEVAYPDTIRVNNKKVDLTPSIWGEPSGLAEIKDPDVLSELRDLWNS